jgi:hypothetical protein
MGTRATWIAIATCLSCLAATERAAAFGFLQGATGTSQVTSHRIVLAVSPERTVLWDELSYTGAPADFLWLLPVREETTFEVANPAWVDALDAVTRPRVSALRAECVSVDTDGGCGCVNPQPAPQSSGSASPPASVQVLRTNTVGPYRMNLVRASDPGALASYVEEGGYVIPPGFESTIESYIADGYDFIAASLRPMVGVTDMKPIRVATKGGTPLLPMRMLLAGAAPVVNLELYVIAEERQTLPELSQVTFDSRRLTWDARLTASNYESLESAALAANDGLSFFTAFASRDPFARFHENADGEGIAFSSSSGGIYATLADLYFAQGRLEAATAAPPCSPVATALRSELEVSDAEPLEQGRLDDLVFACGPMVDLQQALIGMHPARVWLTRLDLELPRDVIAQDYLVAPEPAATSVDPVYAPVRVVNAPGDCPEPIFQSSVAPRRLRPFGWEAAPLLLLAVALRRRLRHRGRA